MIIAENALRSSDFNIPRVIISSNVDDENHRTLEEIWMAETGMILTVQRNFILGTLIEENR
jgi:hypothetical protein